MLDTLTVGELKAQLNHFEDDTPVVSTVSYGDRVGTMQAIAVGDLDHAHLQSTSYSDSGYAVILAEDADEDDPEVLVLNYDHL